MYINNNKQLLAAIAMLSVVWSQNDGLVITKYDNNGVKTKGNYVSGVRNGDWAEYYQGGMTMAKMEKPTQRTP